MKGRPPKPAWLKLATGNPGKRPILKEPTAPKGLPQAPRRLTGDERAAWRDISASMATLGVLQVVDAHAVELAAYHLARRRRLSVYLTNNGECYTTVTKQGCEMQRARPEVSHLSASDAYLAKFFEQCGLTPTGRTRLGVLPDPARKSASWLPPEIRNDGKPVDPKDFA